MLLSTILKAYTTILVISLSSGSFDVNLDSSPFSDSLYAHIATLLALLLPFVSTSFPAYLPSVLYLSYAILTIPLVVHTFRQFLRGTSNLDSESSIPLSLSLAPPLPSPTASSASFPSVVSHHEKLPSVSSSTSTLTAVDHWQSSAHVHLHPTVPFPAPDDLENGQAVHPAGDDQNLSSRMGRSRSRSLFVFLLAAQGSALIGLSFGIAATVLMTASTRQGSATFGSSIYVLLQIIQAAFIVLCITGVMSAYLCALSLGYFHSLFNINLNSACIQCLSADSVVDPATGYSRCFRGSPCSIPSDKWSLSTSPPSLCTVTSPRSVLTEV